MKRTLISAAVLAICLAVGSTALAGGELPARRALPVYQPCVVAQPQPTWFMRCQRFGRNVWGDTVDTVQETTGFVVSTVTFGYVDPLQNKPPVY